VRVVGAPFMLGAEFSYSIIGSFHDCRDYPDAMCGAMGVDRKVPGVAAGSFMVGVDL
jgi:hypothetical protein